MRFSNHKYFAPRETELHFISIFEQCVDLHCAIRLPFNTLVAIFEDGDSDQSTIRDCDDNNVFVRRKGWLYFTPCYQTVYYDTFLNLSYIAIHFSLERYPGMDIFAEQKHWITEFSPADVEEVYRRYHNPDRLHSLSELREFCLRFCNRHWPDIADEDSVRRKRFDPVLNYIRANGTAQTTVAELAELVRLRQESFSHEFSACFHKSPKDVLLDELVSKAAALLSLPHHNVKTVAEALNFSSEYYFSKFFKRQTGQPPGAYQKKQKS